MIAQPEADHAHASGACALPLQGMPRSGLYHLAAFVLPTTTTRLIECCNCHACSCLGRFLLHRGGGHHDSTSGWFFHHTGGFVVLFRGRLRATRASGRQALRRGPTRPRGSRERGAVAREPLLQSTPLAISPSCFAGRTKSSGAGVRAGMTMDLARRTLEPTAVNEEPRDTFRPLPP